MPSNSAGGVFIPSDPPPSTNQVLTTPAITGGTVASAAISAPAISGAATMASGATLTTPTLIATTTSVTATGATGAAGGVLPTVTPAFVTITGANSSGVDLPTGPAGAAYFLNNVFAGTLKVYCVGGTINGTTGTTAYDITNTGNKSAWAYNTSATGAWRIAGNT